MNDMGVLFAIAIGCLLAIGLLVAKAFAFSVAWILWPVGIIAIIGCIGLIGLSGWVP